MSPMIGFTCKKGNVLFSECLKEGFCENRCLSRASLQLLSQQRLWTGKPSTTQLLRGTMQAFLEITTNYYWPIEKQIFMLQGVKAHSNLEAVDDEYSFLEEYFDSDITSISDVLEIENGTSTLIDYKLTGSYKVGLALGLYSVDIPTGEYYKNGKEKTKKAYRQSDDKIEMDEWILQLNHYRTGFETKGFFVDRMKIQAIVRDGNTYVAKNRGITETVYMIDVPRMDDAEVEAYFEVKKFNLLQALKKESWLNPCDEKERWNNDNKCKEYCAVAFVCSYGKKYKNGSNAENLHHILEQGKDAS